MKRLPLLLILGCVGGMTPSQGAEQFTLLRSGEIRAERPGAELIPKLVRLLEHCDVELLPEMALVPPEYFDWSAALAHPDRIHLRLEHTLRLTLKDNSVIEVGELILPMVPGKWPGPILVRQGEAARAFTKYRAEDLAAVREDAAVAEVFPRRSAAR